MLSVGCKENLSYRPFFMANETKKEKKEKKIYGSSVAKTNVGQNCKWLFKGWKKKGKKNGEYIGSAPAFSAAHHAACMQLIGNNERREYLLVWSSHIAEYGSTG